MNILVSNGSYFVVRFEQPILSFLSSLAVGFFMFAAVSGSAEAQGLNWAVRAGGMETTGEVGQSIAVDGSGNVYVTGSFRDGATFGSTMLTSAGDNDVFVAKYNSSGVLQWVKQGGGAANDAGLGITADTSGNIYVTGFFQGMATFSGTMLSSDMGSEDLFLAKYDATNGNLIWVTKAGGPNTDRGLSLAVDGSGNIYVTGRFEGLAFFDSIDLLSLGLEDVFLAKYDSSGAVQWVRRGGGSDSDQGAGVAVDGSGNIYLTGYFHADITFGVTTLNSDSGSRDVFVAKYDSTGANLWAKKAGGPDTDRGFGIAVDVTGNIYVTGLFNGMASFDATTLDSSGSDDVFVAKYDTIGNLLWAKQAGGTGSDVGFGIAVDGLGNSYITGSFNIHSTPGPATFGFGEPNATTLSGDRDIFVAKYNSNGTLAWARSAGGGPNTNQGLDVAVDALGNSYVTGFFTDATATFGPGEINETPLLSAGGADIFVAKYRGTRTSVDFNGDGTSDIVVFRGGAWLFHNFTTGIQTSGTWTGSSAGCIPVAMDYDGDGKTDFTQRCGGAWHFYNANGSYNKGIWVGSTAGDRPVPADYDGDGKDNVVIYRGGAWLFYDFATGAIDPAKSTWTGGGGGCIPVPMDYDGDGKKDFTQLCGGSWHFYNSNGSYNKGIWTGGVAGDKPVPADYDGNGTEDVVLFRGGAWLFYDFATGLPNPAKNIWTGAPAHWTGGTTLPAPIDYDGDGKVDFTVYSGGPWHFYNANGSYNKGIWTGGVVGDRPISRRLLP